MEIVSATTKDLESIMLLHKKYHVNSMNPLDKPDGFVTTNFTSQQLLNLLEKEEGITIAKEDKDVIGYAMAASWQFWREWPFFEYMIESLSQFKLDNEVLTTLNSYQYGPICIDKKYRGSGLFQDLFFASLKSMSVKFPIMITFINQSNHRSYEAHTKKTKMRSIGTFTFNDNNYYTLGCFANRH